MDTRPSPSPATSSRSKPTSTAPNHGSTSASTSSSTRQQHIPAQPQTSTPPPTASAASSSKPGRRPSTSAGSSTSKNMENHDKPTRSSSTINLKQKSSKKLDEASKVNKTEELLKGHNQDLESIRNIITCKICDRLLYEPYVVACGHIYCYSCLSHWFVNNKKRKTCPDCRTLVTQMPAPAYLIRDMTAIFLNRAELLPVGETLEQHKEWQKEEADIVQQDRDNKNPRTGGLFKGLFSPINHLRNRNFGPIRDLADGVDRCPICTWELQEEQCANCGYGAPDEEIYTDYDPEIGSSEDIDGDIDIEDYNEDFLEDADFPDEDDLEAGYDEWSLDDPHSVTMARWLGNARGVQFMARPRGTAAHLTAGRRRRYSASINDSEMFEDQGMDNIEEEDEEEMEDDEDSSMNSFIDDGENTEHGTERSTSVESQTPQPQPQPPINSGSQRRNRRIESETPSFSSAASAPSNTDENDEDDEDEEEGPIRPGRQRRQQRMLARANGSRAASSTSTENSADHELDEDTQHLLSRHGWSPLAPENMEMEEDDDESDGGRTTVGWDPTAISSARPRITNSLTPLADRTPLQTRPRSRVGQPRLPDGSRGLRRRSSVLSVSTVSYEDGEADDDDSEIDRDGDTLMQSQQLRARTSRVRLHGGLVPAQQVGRTTLGDGIDADTDDGSDDTTVQSPRRRQQNLARQEYNPRISWMFAQHQNDLQAVSNHSQHWLAEDFRSTTPIARPRTANRNRMSQSTIGPPFSPLSNTVIALPPPSNVSSRARRAVVDQDRVPAAIVTATATRSERSGSMSSNFGPEGGNPNDAVRLDREVSVDSANSLASLTTATSARHGRPNSRQSSNSIPPSVISGPEDIIDRPASRLPSRPPSSSGRRGSQGFIGYPNIQMSPGPGLHYAARQMQPPPQTRNPYFVATYGNAVRSRPSTQRLREQSSTATLRASGSRRALRPQQSRTEFREEAIPAGVLRSQWSRTLRSQPSSQRLQGQPSIRALRQGETVHIAQNQVGHPGIGLGAAPRATGNIQSSRLSEDERQRRASDLVRTRQRELSTTNPFASNGRRPSVSSGNGAAAQNLSITYGSGRPMSNAPVMAPAPGSSNFTQDPSSSQGSPTINRRRSHRSIGLSPGALPQSHHGNVPPSRPRQMVPGSSVVQPAQVVLATNNAA